MPGSLCGLLSLEWNDLTHTHLLGGACHEGRARSRKARRMHIVGVTTSGCGQRSPQATEDPRTLLVSDVRNSIAIALLEKASVVGLQDARM